MLGPNQRELWFCNLDRAKNILKHPLFSVRHDLVNHALLEQVLFIQEPHETCLTTFYHRRRRRGEISETANICPPCQSTSSAVTETDPPPSKESTKKSIMFYEQLAKSIPSKDPKLIARSIRNSSTEPENGTRTPPIDLSTHTGALSQSQAIDPIKHVYLVKKEVVL
jgi:hypothetical protein